MRLKTKTFLLSRSIQYGGKPCMKGAECFDSKRLLKIVKNCRNAKKTGNGRCVTDVRVLIIHYDWSVRACCVIKSEYCWCLSCRCSPCPVWDYVTAYSIDMSTDPDRNPPCPDPREKAITRPIPEEEGGKIEDDKNVKKRSVSFPDDEHIVTQYFEPANPWQDGK